MLRFIASQSSYPYVTVETHRHTAILDAVRAAFGGKAATKPALLAAAEEAQARPDAIEILHRMPENPALGHARELWAQIPDLPLN